MVMNCWKCKKGMKPVKDDFHGFTVDGWKCPACAEIVYDEKSIQPILEANKRKNLLMAYLYDTSDSVPIDEAIAEARKKGK